jgi:hypothetical protein
MLRNVLSKDNSNNLSYRRLTNGTNLAGLARLTIFGLLTVGTKATEGERGANLALGASGAFGAKLVLVFIKRG